MRTISQPSKTKRRINAANAIVTVSDHDLASCLCKKCGTDRNRLTKKADKFRKFHANRVKRAERIIRHMNGICLLGRERTVRKVKEEVRSKLVDVEFFLRNLVKDNPNCLSDEDKADLNKFESTIRAMREKCTVGSADCLKGM